MPSTSIKPCGCRVGRSSSPISWNFAAVTLRMPEWHYLFNFIGPMAMTKEAFLLQVRQYVPADEYVMVGNIQGVSGESDDHGAASRAGWRFISETAFSLGAR